MSRIIKIVKDKIFLTKDFSLDISQTSLTGEYLSFRTKDTYFKVKIVDFKDTVLTLEVIDYNPEDIEPFFNQNAKADISFINFLPMQWVDFEKYLATYVKGKLINKGIVIGEQQQKQPIESYPIYVPYSPPKNTVTDFNTKKEISIVWEELEFGNGFISFQYATQTIKINNDFITPKLYLLKKHIKKVLGSNLKVYLEFVMAQGRLLKINATSKTIEDFNNDTITLIKDERIGLLTSVIDEQKPTFSLDEILYKIESQGNIFNETEKDIINSLTRNIRNKKHLDYLSSLTNEITFTLKPIFGFIFCLSHNEMNYYMWELLNTHATYSWGFSKDLPNQKQRVDTILESIRESGRENYKKRYKNGEDNDLLFKVIEHTNINEDDNGFDIWKEKLQAFIQ